MALIDRHRFLIRILFCAVLHPSDIVPGVAGQIRCPRCGAGAQLRPVRIGICLVDLPALRRRDQELVQLSLLHAGKKGGPDADRTHLRHRVLLLIPAVELADHVDLSRIRSPDAEEVSLLSVLYRRMGAQLLIDVVVRALSEQVAVLLRHEDLRCCLLRCRCLRRCPLRRRLLFRCLLCCLLCFRTRFCCHTHVPPFIRFQSLLVVLEIFLMDDDPIILIIALLRKNQHQCVQVFLRCPADGLVHQIADFLRRHLMIRCLP